MKSPLIILLFAPLSALGAADAADPFTPYLDGKAPPITRELAPPPESVTVRRILFRIQDKNEAYAVIATPKTLGRHPAMLLLHGSGGFAEEEKAMAWAQRGYVAVAAATR